MRILLLLFLLFPPSQALAISVPGGAGTSSPNDVTIGSTSPCLNGEGAVSNGTSWSCTSVAAGSGDSAQINGLSMTDINLIDTTGDGAIILTRDTVPVVDTVALTVKDGAISPAKMKSADFGDYTCAAGVCTVDNNAIALGTKTTGPYLGDISVGNGIACTGCGLADEGQTKLLGLDLTSTLTWAGAFQIDTAGSFKLPYDTTLPTTGVCDATHGAGTVRIDSDAIAGHKLNICNGSTGWETSDTSVFDVAGVNVPNPNLVNTGDITFPVSGSNISGTVNPNSVALGTNTVGNYLGAVAGSGHVTCSGCTAAEGNTGTLGVAGLDQADMAANLDFSGKTSVQIPTSATPTTSAAGWIAFDSNAWASAHGTIQIFDGTATAYMVAIQTSDTCINGQVPTFNTGGTWTCETNGAIPAGTSTELQYRAGAATLGAVPGSSVSSGNVTLAATATMSAGTVTAPAKTTEPGNKIDLNANDTAFTNDPTCANSGTANKLTIIDKDETASDAWVVCDGTTELFSFSSPSITPAMLTTAAKIQNSCISVSVMGQNLFVFKIPAGVTATAVRFSCVSSGTVTTAPTYTLQECATDGSSCVSVHASPITCGATEGTTSTFSDSTWAASAWMRLLSGNTGIVAGMTQLCADWTPS